MSGSRTKQREYRQVIFGVRGSEHVKVVTKVMPFPVGIPADVAVRLVIDPVALTVPDALFQAVAGTGLTLSCTSIDRCSITGNSQVIQVNKSLIAGSIQEQGFENFKQACSWIELFGRFYFESGQEVIGGDFLYRWSLVSFFCQVFLAFAWAGGQEQRCYRCPKATDGRKNHRKYLCQAYPQPRTLTGWHGDSSA